MPEKDRRRLRRKNHFSLDRDRDHSSRVIPSKKHLYDKEYPWDNQDWERFTTEDDLYWLSKQLGLTSKE